MLATSSARCISPVAHPIHRRRSRIFRPEIRPCRGGCTGPSPPQATAGGSYRVMRGDTLYAIAFKHGVDFRELASWNRIMPPYRIYAGQEFRSARLVSGAPSQAWPSPAQRPTVRRPHGQPAATRHIPMWTMPRPRKTAASRIARQPRCVHAADGREVELKAAPSAPPRRRPCASRSREPAIVRLR